MISVREADLLGIKIIKEKLIAQLSVSYGTNRRKAIEYINNLITLNLIKETWDKKNTYLELFKSNQVIEV